MQRRAASSVLICSRPSLFDKYGMHRPLTRQSTRFKCEGLELSTSTLADRVGYGTAALLPRAAPKSRRPARMATFLGIGPRDHYLHRG